MTTPNSEFTKPHAAKTWVNNLWEMFRSARWRAASVQSGHSSPPQAAQSLPERNFPANSIGLFIDAENLSPAALEEIMAVSAQFGRCANPRRAFGDWTLPHMARWIPHLNRHAITPVQQHRSSLRKNASDIALTISVMDLIHSGGPKVKEVKPILIASSDADFAPLAVRLRSSGVMVVGFGERKSAASYVAAFDRFIFAEEKPPRCEPETEIAPLVTVAYPLDLLQLERFEELLLTCLAPYANGWVDLAVVGQLLRSRFLGFGDGPFGRLKLSRLVASLDASVEVKREPTQIYVRRKKMLSLVEPVKRSSKEEPDVFTRLRATLGVKA